MHNLLLLLLLQLHALDPVLFLLEACLHDKLEHLFFFVLLPLDLLLRLHGGFKGRLILCLLETEKFRVDLVRFNRLLRLRGRWIFNGACFSLLPLPGLLILPLLPFLLLSGGLLPECLLLLLQHHLECLLVHLGVPLYHQLLEGHKVLNGHYLRDNLRMLRVCARFVTSLQELLLGDFQLGHKLTQQLVDQLFEGLHASLVFD